MSRSSDFPADIFVAAAGSSVHLLRRRPPAAGGAAAADDFAPVVVGHTCGVNAVRWNRNNKVVASGCADGQVQLLYSSGEVMCVLPRNGATRAADLAAVTALSWSTGSKRLAAGSDNGTVFVFDMSKQNVGAAGQAGGAGVHGVQTGGRKRRRCTPPEPLRPALHPPPTGGAHPAGWARGRRDGGGVPT